MLIDTSFLLAGGAAALLAGVSKGGFGSAAAFVGVALLALVLPPAVALAVMLPVLMVIDLATLGPFWRRWSWADARLLALGALPGLALGLLLLSHANADMLRGLIGALALGFVLWQGIARCRAAPAQPLPRWVGATLGALAGLTSFIAHAGGPAAAVWLLSRRLDKTRYQATTVLLFGVLNLLKCAAYGGLGLFSAQTLAASALLAPAALLGAWLGVRAHWRIPERGFFILTYLALGATGIRLIWVALQ